MFSSNYKTKLSSAGLIYREFGKSFLKEALPEAEPEALSAVYEKLYQDFIEGVDGIDNGIPQYPVAVAPNYIINTDLASRVGRLNPSWNSESQDSDQRFQEAMKLAGSELIAIARNLLQEWWPAREIVQTAFDRRLASDASGLVLELHRSCPWKEHLMAIEKQAALGKDQVLLYVVYEDEQKRWRIQAVPDKDSGAFANRKSLPEPWRGLRDKELEVITGIEGATFVHASGFIGGHMTREGAMKMAKAAIAFKQ